MYTHHHRAYVGTFGMGKTLSMVYDSLYFMKSKRKIYSNFPLFFPKQKKDSLPILYPFGGYIEDPVEFLKKMETENDSLFLMDEAGTFVGSYDWDKIPLQFWQVILQCRKRKVDLWFTVQDIKFTAKRLRNPSTIKYVIATQKLYFNIPFKYTLNEYLQREPVPWVFGYRSVYYDPIRFSTDKEMTIEQEKKYITGRRFLMKKSFNIAYTMYDTNHVVSTSLAGLKDYFDSMKPKRRRSFLQVSDI